MIQLSNPVKVGTLILSYYRRGTHFLRDVVAHETPGAIKYDEICNNGEIDQLISLTNEPGYKVCILNNTISKFFLASDSELQKQWHIINLTRKDTLAHFMSYWFWRQNPMDNRFNDTCVFKHHATPPDVYADAVKASPKVHYSIQNIIPWLQGQLINTYITADVTLDYAQLPLLANNNVTWQANCYDAIKLSDIFLNHEEIEQFLTNFNI